MEAELQKLEIQISQLKELRRQMIQQVESRYISVKKAEEFEVALNEMTGAIEAFEGLRSKILGKIRRRSRNFKKDYDECSSVPSPEQLKIELHKSQQRIEYAKICYYNSLHGKREPDTWLGLIKQFFKDLATPHK